MKVNGLFIGSHKLPLGGSVAQMRPHLCSYRVRWSWSSFYRLKGILHWDTYSNVSLSPYKLVASIWTVDAFFCRDVEIKAGKMMSPCLERDGSRNRCSRRATSLHGSLLPTRPKYSIKQSLIQLGVDLVLEKLVSEFPLQLFCQLRQRS